MILYHAISSYQLLEIILHKLIYHKNKKAILILPDFIVKKYPKYRRLVELEIFSEVYLFPYLYIPHDKEKAIKERVKKAYHALIPYDLDEFSHVYIAGSHFYFSLYLIECHKVFNIFEDAAGMLSRSEELYNNLHKGFPLHAEIAKKYGLFNGENEYIDKIYCLKKLQTQNVMSRQYINFDVEKLLRKHFIKRKRIIEFFGVPIIKAAKSDVILLTQNFAVLGVMSNDEQDMLYRKLEIKIGLENRGLIIKVHPDDSLKYEEIFPYATIIKEIFPAELLPYIFTKKPDTIMTINSTAIENLKKSFKNIICIEI